MSKRKIFLKSGSGATEDLPSCGYFKQLMFLSDSIGNRPTFSNVPSNMPLSPPQSPPVLCNNAQRQQTNEPVTTVTIAASESNPVLSHPTSTYGEKPAKRAEKRKEISTVDALLAQSLMADMNRAQCPPKPKESDCPDDLFCRSLVPHFKKLSERKNLLAKTRVMEVLLNFCSDNE